MIINVPGVNTTPSAVEIAVSDEVKKLTGAGNVNDVLKKIASEYVSKYSDVNIKRDSAGAIIYSQIFNAVGGNNTSNSYVEFVNDDIIIPKDSKYVKINVKGSTHYSTSKAAYIKIVFNGIVYKDGQVLSDTGHYDLAYTIENPNFAIQNSTWKLIVSGKYINSTNVGSVNDITVSATQLY